MPIDEISDYPEKMQEFDLHWGSVNLELGGTPETDFKLAGDFDRAAFGTLRDSVVTALTNQEGLDNNLDFARSDRDQWRAELRQTLILFRNTVKALLPDSRYIRALPDTPDERSDQQKLLDAWDDAAHVWTQINTEQPAEVGGELKLRGGYTLAQFQTDLAEMRTRYTAVKASERAASDGRGERDELLESAFERMSQYRQRLPLVLPPDHPLLASMPKLRPGANDVGIGGGGEGGGGATLATVRYAFVETGASVYDVRVEMIDGLVDVQALKLVEGTEVFVTAFSPQPGEIFTTQWSGVIIDGEIDEVKIQNSAGEDIAIGVFDPTVPDPAP